MAELGAFLGNFGELGLVFSILMTAIFFLGKGYMREKRMREQCQKEFNDYLQQTQKDNIQTIMGFTQSMDIIKESIAYIKAKI